MRTLHIEVEITFLATEPWRNPRTLPTPCCVTMQMWDVKMLRDVDASLRASPKRRLDKALLRCEVVWFKLIYGKCLKYSNFYGNNSTLIKVIIALIII
jgi:hypothetical protein